MNQARDFHIKYAVDTDINQEMNVMSLELLGAFTVMVTLLTIMPGPDKLDAGTAINSII